MTSAATKSTTFSGFRGNKFAVLDIEAPTAGTYYIVLGRVADSGSGRYRLSVTRTDDYPADIRTAGTVEVGGFATGEIETRRDVDWFKVDARGGGGHTKSVSSARR